MRICPTCNRTYDDDTLVFCLDDGTRLSAAYARTLDPDRTEILPGGLPQTAPSPPPPRSTIPSSLPATYQREKRGGNAWIIIGGLLVLAVVGLIVVAGFFAWQARDNSNPEPSRARTATPPDTSHPVERPTAEPEPASTPELEWLNGVWSGEGYQTDTKTTWAVELDVHNQTYSINYPDIPCRGKWELIDKNSREASFTEVITQGTDRCGNNSHVMVEKVSATEISCRFTHAGSRAVIATVVLSKKAE